MIRALVCGAAAAVFAAQGYAQDLAKAQTTANQVCAACHAADGNSIAPANPNIAGQFPEYLHKQLVDFKAQGGKKPARESPIMMGMVANLADADMKGLAAYYAGQKLKPAAASDKNLAAAGQRLWRGGNTSSGVPACAGCHGPAGAGTPTCPTLSDAKWIHITGAYPEIVTLVTNGVPQPKEHPAPMPAKGGGSFDDAQVRALAAYVYALSHQGAS